MRHVQTFSVRFEYSVYFGEDLLQPGRPELLEAMDCFGVARSRRVLVFMDAGVAEAWPALGRALRGVAASSAGSLELVADAQVIPGGEQAKADPAVLQEILQKLHDHRMDRHAFVLAIGGGAVLDVVGYAAAITHRGVRHVRMPTTVLAQADGGVGVKNGVNAFQQKNYLGTFAPPHAVLNDASLLRTLSDRDRRAGLAEAIKVAIVRDAAFFGWIEDHATALRAGSHSHLKEAVRRSAQLHLQHIAGGGDPFERGSARPLDFGHWSAHRLELLSGYELRHGEAVALGVAMDVLYSARIGMCTARDAERVCAVLRALGFRLWHHVLARMDHGRLALLQGLRDFREHLGGELTVPLLRRVGLVEDVHAIDEEVVTRVVGQLESQDSLRPLTHCTTAESHVAIAIDSRAGRAADDEL